MNQFVTHCHKSLKDFVLFSSFMNKVQLWNVVRQFLIKLCISAVNRAAQVRNEDIYIMFHMSVCVFFSL